MKQFSVEFRWAFTFLLAQTLWIMFEKTLGFHGDKIQYQPLFSMLFNFILIAIYVLAIRDKKKKIYNNQMTWQEGFVSGLMLTLIIALFTTMTEYTKHNVISPYLLEDMKDLILAENRMTVEDANNYFSFSKTLSNTIFFTISIGVLITSIVAWIMKSKELNNTNATNLTPSKNLKKRKK
jgi:hypothetical protein